MMIKIKLLLIGVFIVITSLGCSDYGAMGGTGTGGPYQPWYGYTPASVGLDNLEELKPIIVLRDMTCVLTIKSDVYKIDEDADDLYLRLYIENRAIADRKDFKLEPNEIEIHFDESKMVLDTIRCMEIKENSIFTDLVYHLASVPQAKEYEYSGQAAGMKHKITYNLHNFIKVKGENINFRELTGYQDEDIKLFKKYDWSPFDPNITFTKKAQRGR